MVAPPAWIQDFANAVATQIHGHDVLPPLGCHYQLVENIWEVTIFASHTEMVGGACDGQISHCSFSVDIKKILELFSYVEEVAWQTQPMGLNDDLGAHLAVEGIYDDKQVWLRITAVAPDQFGAGRRVLVNQQEIEELW